MSISPSYPAFYFPTCWVSLKVKWLRNVAFNFTCWFWAFWTQVTWQGPWAAAVAFPGHLCPSFSLDEISTPPSSTSNPPWSQEPTHFLSSVMGMLLWFFLFSSTRQFFSPPAHFTSIFGSTHPTSHHLTSIFIYSKSSPNVCFISLSSISLLPFTLEDLLARSLLHPPPWLPWLRSLITSPLLDPRLILSPHLLYLLAAFDTVPPLLQGFLPLTSRTFTLFIFLPAQPPLLVSSFLSDPLDWRHSEPHPWTSPLLSLYHSLGDVI